LVNTIKSGELHIWRYTVDERDYESEKNLSTLSQEETERYKRFIYPRDAVKYSANHRFMRQVIAGYLDCGPGELVFSYTPLGKPYIKNSGLFFNLSYRNKLGLLAISKDDEVGVDIEYMKEMQDVATFASFSFSEEEKELIFTKDILNQDVFFTFWAFKEAYIKATGTGLSVDISKINLAGFLFQEAFVLPFDNTLWSLKSIDAEKGYKAAFAIKGKIPEYMEFNYDESRFNLFKNS
jgi:4'-phosphopantetheinyl transferase